MSEREEVLTYFGWQTCVMGDECCNDECRIPVQMADEIVRLRSALTTAERERDEARREREEADEALAACQAQASGEIADLRAQLTAMTEARDLWQSEARIQQAHRERAERVVELIKAALPDFKFGAWLLLHASTQRVNEHRSMGESAGVLTEHIERIDRALDANHASEGEG